MRRAERLHLLPASRADLVTRLQPHGRAMAKTGVRLRGIRGDLVIFHADTNLARESLIESIAEILYGPFSVEVNGDGSGLTFRRQMYDWGFSSNYDPIAYVLKGHVRALSTRPDSPGRIEIGVGYVYPLLLAVSASLLFGSIIMLLNGGDPTWLAGLLVVSIPTMAGMIYLFPFRLIGKIRC